MNQDEAKQFLIKLDEFRPEVGHYLFSSAVVDHITELENTYDVENDYFTDLINWLILGRVKLEDIPRKIEVDLKRTPQLSKEIALDFLGMVFLPLDSYIPQWNIRKIFLEWRGNPNDYEEYLSGFVESIWEANDEVIDDHIKNFDSNRDNPGEFLAIKNIFEHLLASVLLSKYEDNKQALNSSIFALLNAAPTLKRELEEALYTCAEKVSSDKIKLDGKFVEPSVANWLKDFITRNGTGMFDNIVLTEFITKSENVKSLDVTSRNLLLQMLITYRNLKFFPSSMADRQISEWEIIPIQQTNEELLRERRSKLPRSPLVAPREKTAPKFPPATVTNASTPAMKAVYDAYQGEEKERMDILHEKENLLTASKNDTKKLREEFFRSVRSKNISKTIAAIQLLAERNDILAFMSEDEALKKFLTHAWQEKYGEKISQEFQILPQSPKFLRLFLQYVLEDRLGLSGHDAARVGAQIGTIYKKIGKPEFSRLAYFDMEHKTFHWLEE